MTGRPALKLSNRIRNFSASFELHRRSSALQKQSCCSPRRLGRCDLITQEWHISHNQRSLRPAGHRPRLVNDRFAIVASQAVNMMIRWPRFFITVRSGARTLLKLQSFSNLVLASASWDTAQTDHILHEKVKAALAKIACRAGEGAVRPWPR
jgi:hypothetical protein